MNLSKQKLILIDGPMGAGKTTTAGLLYKKLGCTAFLGLDRVKWFVSDFSRTCEKDRIMTNKVVLAMCREYINYRLSIVMEQSFRKKDVINLYLDLSKKHKIPLLVYELTAPKRILLNRIKHRPYMCPGKKNFPLWRILQNINAYPHKPFAPVRIIFDSSKLSARQIVNRIVKDIKAV